MQFIHIISYEPRGLLVSAGLCITFKSSVTIDLVGKQVQCLVANRR